MEKNFDKRAKAKRYLRQVQRSWTIARQLREELSRLELAEVSLGSPDYSGDRVQHSAKPEASFVSTVEKRADIEIKLKKKLMEHDLIRVMIVDEIHEMEKTEYIRLLYGRYVEGLSVNQLARVMFYSVDRVKHIHLEALDAFYECNKEAIEERFKANTF